MEATATNKTGPALADSVSDVVARRLSALGEPTRLKLVMEVRARDGASVQELADAVGSSLPNVSKHLQVLYQSGILTRRKEGTYVRYAVASDAVAALVTYAIRILGASVRPPEGPEARASARAARARAHIE
jgi:DNA-binding transcriptional ArsR family regulator